MMNLVVHTLIGPQIEIAEQRTLGRKVLGNRPPLAARAQDVHETVDNLSHIDGTPPTAPLGLRNQRPYQGPFLCRQIARVAQLVAIIAGTIGGTPHRQSLLTTPTPLITHHSITS